MIYYFQGDDMNSIKLERINSAMVKEISQILANEIKNQNIQFVTVTAVKTTNDLSFAKVYVTTLNEDKKKETMEALIGAKGLIRKALGERIEIRHIPELEFVYDESIEYGRKIEEKIKEIHGE